MRVTGAHRAFPPPRGAVAQYCAEMFPLAVRAKATGLTTMTNWAGNFCVGFFPPILFSSLGFRTFWIFAGMCALCLAAGCVLPETRGKSLEEITVMFEQRLGGDDASAALPPHEVLEEPADECGGAESVELAAIARHSDSSDAVRL